MNFKRGAQVRVVSEIENMFGGYRKLSPKLGELGEIDSDIEIMGGGVPAVRIMYRNDFFWWVHPKHLELVK